MKSSKYVVTLAALALMGAASAQTTTPTPTASTTTTAKRGVNQRQTNQQDRIGEGLENGSLTAGEAGRLENKEVKINKEEHAMRKADDGKLTAADKAKLESQESKVSKDIYAQKHDTQTQSAGKGEINGRKDNQQQRIGEGLENGSLKAGEADRLEHQQQGINRTERGMREADGGKLTQADRRAINKEQNQASKKIYRDKHNARKR
jgi:hypothetical protein